MSVSSIFLSGWEYNRILSPDPLRPVTSALPASILWNGAAQFWLFSKVLCTKEALDEELRATAELNWASGWIYDDLRRRGFLETVDLADEAEKDPSFREEFTDAWSALRQTYDSPRVLDYLEKGQAYTLEAIKLRLLGPLLKRRDCVQNASPNTINNWIEDVGAPQDAGSAEEQGLRALAAPISGRQMVLRAGFRLCNPPGTGGGPQLVAAFRKQKEVETKFERPMIPRLFAGMLPHSEFLRELRPHAAIYAPVNERLRVDYRANIDQLQRLRDVARSNLWKDLHEDWLPRLQQDPTWLPEFEKLINKALLSAQFPGLEGLTNVGIVVAAGVAGLGAGGAAVQAGLDPWQVGLIGGTAALGARTALDTWHRNSREDTKTLTLFYQNAMKVVASGSKRRR